MKLSKLLLSAIAVFLLLTNISESQAQKRVKNYLYAVTGNPVALAWDNLPVTYEQQIGPRHSFTGFFNLNFKTDWVAYMAGGSYRMYFDVGRAKPINGLSAGPVLTVGSWDYDGTAKQGGMTFGIGAEIAYKMIFNEGFVIEPIAQVSYNVIKPDDLDYDAALILGFNIGYAW